MINDALHQGQFALPIPYHNNDFPVVQYADDTILIMQAEITQVLHLKNILSLFSESTGLKVNYSKSSMVLVNVPTNKLHDLAAAFGCQVGTMPFTYLGQPMGTTKPRMGTTKHLSWIEWKEDWSLALASFPTLGVSKW